MSDIYLLTAGEADGSDLLAFLRAAGHKVTTGGDAQRALPALRTVRSELIFLETTLPAPQNRELLHRIVAATGVPIFVVGTDAQEAAGLLDAGAEEYMPRPATTEELLARLRRSLRHGPQQHAQALACRDVVLFPSSRRVTVGSELVPLTGREFELLEVFLRHPGIALTRNQLLNAVWGIDFYGPPKIVDVYVRYLRSKLDVRFGREYIATVRGVGYLFIKEN